ncbi:MAG: DUF5615 family PIN-like protein [Chloroflexota bacterium]
MKLLLDEHFSPAIAKQLRARGFDVLSVAEAEPGREYSLRQQSDEALLRWCRAERRTLVTEDAGDFMVLHRACVARGETHAGIVFTSPQRYPRNARAVGSIIEALDTFIRSSAEDALISDIAWL